MIQPGETLPSIFLNRLDGGVSVLPKDCTARLTMLVVYRGIHCGVCKSYLEEFSESVEVFERMGVEPFFVSSDTEDKAREASAKWGKDKLKMHFGLDEPTGKQLRLWLSEATNEKQPARYFEPALYLIKPDGELLFVSIQSMPFGRTSVESMLIAIPKIMENGIPAKGTLRY